MSNADRPSVLSSDEVDKELRDRGLNWQLEGGALSKTARGRDFASALDYVNRVGSLAEQHNHHPDISISWNTVTLRLVTHSAGGITGADLDMAARIDGLDPPAG
jgi:4a-hydroxytetrahydrobiopterin dehydratase